MPCLKCGAEIERKPGPGRPPSYCGEPCRRLAERELKRLDTRIARYEDEQRELKATRPTWPNEQMARERRLRFLRKWIAADRARLQDLIVGGRGNQDESTGGRDVSTTE